MNRPCRSAILFKAPLLALLLGMLGSVSAWPQGGQEVGGDNEPRFEVYTFQGYSQWSDVVIGQTWAPITIQVLNEVNDYEGVFVITGSDNLTHHLPFNSAKGSMKQFQTLIYVEDTTELRVEMRARRHGQLGAPIGARMAALPAGTVATLVLPDQPGRHQALEAAPADDVTPPRVLYGQGPLLPYNWAGYEGIAAMVWDGHAFSRFSPEQMEALMRWIETGGQLILCAGRFHAELRATPLQPLLPVDISGSFTVPASSIANSLSLNPPENDTPVVLAQATAKDGMEVLYELDGVPLIVQHRVGAGRVIYMGWSLQDPVWSQWPQAARELQAFMLRQRPAFRFGLEDNWMNRIATTLRVNAYAPLPSPLSVARFMFIFIALLVPVNYAVWSWFKRRELAWVCVPLLSIGFGMWAYQVGVAEQDQLLGISSITVTDAAVDAQRGESRSFFSVYSPTMRNYTVAFEDRHAHPFILREFEVFTQGRDFQTTTASVFAQAQGMTLLHDGKSTVNDFHIHQWSSRSFQATHSSPLGGGVSGMVRHTPEGLHCTMTNNTPHDFDQLFLFLRSGHGFPLPALPAGESIEQTLSGSGQAIGLEEMIAPLADAGTFTVDSGWGRTSTQSVSSLYPAPSLLEPSVEQRGRRQDDYVLVAMFDDAPLTPVLNDRTPEGAHSQARHILFVPLPSQGAADALPREYWSLAEIEKPVPNQPLEYISSAIVGEHNIVSKESYYRLRPVVAVDDAGFYKIEILLGASTAQMQQGPSQTELQVALYDASKDTWIEKENAQPMVITTAEARRCALPDRHDFVIRVSVPSWHEQHRWGQEYKMQVENIKGELRGLGRQG